ncbi:MAG: hypothetical protein JEZ12_13120 [Desulfobacterium sp.]|nr:hypothetical protein [Desulfobacterium sp.]
MGDLSLPKNLCNSLKAFGIKDPQNPEEIAKHKLSKFCEARGFGYQRLAALKGAMMDAGYTLHEGQFVKGDNLTLSSLSPEKMMGLFLESIIARSEPALIQKVEVLQAQAEKKLETRIEHLRNLNESYHQAVLEGNETITRGNELMNELKLDLLETRGALKLARQEIKASQDARAQDIEKLKLSLFDALLKKKSGE